MRRRRVVKTSSSTSAACTPRPAPCRRVAALGCGLSLFFFFGVMPPARGASPVQPASAPSVPPVPSTPATDCLQDPDCVALLRTAKGLSAASQANAALTAYQQAYDRSHTHWILINVGRIQQKLGRPADAIATYRRYLDSPEASQEPTEQVTQVRRYLREAEQDLVRAQNPVPASEPAPLYKKWWFWTALAGGVLAAGAATIGIVAATRPTAAPERMVPANVLQF